MKVTVDATGAGHDRGSVLTVEDVGLSVDDLTGAIETYAMSHGNKAAKNVLPSKPTDKDWMGVYVDMLNVCRKFPAELGAVFPSLYHVYSCWGGNSDISCAMSFENVINEARRLHAQMSVYRSIIDPTMTECDEQFRIRIVPTALDSNHPLTSVNYDYDQPDTPQPRETETEQGPSTLLGLTDETQKDLWFLLECFVRDCVASDDISANNPVAGMSDDQRTVGQILDLLNAKKT